MIAFLSIIFVFSVERAGQDVPVIASTIKMDSQEACEAARQELNKGWAGPGVLISTACIYDGD